jgi:hypothetical protein
MATTQRNHHNFEGEKSIRLQNKAEKTREPQLAPQSRGQKGKK